jgi:hypothetical protein
VTGTGRPFPWHRGYTIGVLSCAVALVALAVAFWVVWPATPGPWGKPEGYGEVWASRYSGWAAPPISDAEAEEIRNAERTAPAEGPVT